MVGGLSRASAACSERGRARKPTPNAFTNVATASPAVRATVATAIGITTAVATPPAARPCTRACSSSHSLTNAGPSGNADPASAPSPNAAVVPGMPGRSPPSESRSRLPVACSTEPAARNSSVLNAAWLITCSSAAVNANPASSMFPAAANSPPAPTPIRTKPMFSVVE